MSEESFLNASGKPTSGKNLLVNYISLLGGTVGAKALSLVTVLILTRYLAVEDFGRYSLVFSYWALLNTLVDFGGSQILAREVSRDPANPRPAMESVIYLRLLGCLFFLPMGFLLARWLGLDDTLAILAFLGIFAAFETFYDVFFSASMRLDQNARSRLFSSFGNVLLIAFAVMLRWPLTAIVLIGLMNPVLKLWFDYRYAPFQWRLNAPDWTHIRRIAADSWPLWLVGLQYIILARVDTFMLQKLAPNGSYELGIYSAAFRFSEIMALLINALCPALLPLLVRHMYTPDKIRFLTTISTRLILTILMLMSLGIFWFASWISGIYGPGYEESAPCIRILIGSQALVAVNTLCYQLLIVYNAQGKRIVILSSILMALLNIGLNFWLIPWLHAQGAAWATVITELAMVLSMLWFLRRFTPIRLGRDILLIELLTLAACLPALFWGEGLGWVSLLLFPALVFGLRLLTVEQIRQLAQERLHPETTTG